MNIDDIITLDNDARYFILDVIEYDDITYYLAVGLFEDDSVDIQDFVFFTYKNINGEEEVEVVSDQQTLAALYVVEAESVVLEEYPNGEQIIEEFNRRLENLNSDNE